MATDRSSSVDGVKRPPDKGWSRRAIIIVALFLVISAAILVALGFALKWSFSDSIGVAALAVSIFGFALAIHEIQRARTVALATQEKVDKTLREMGRRRLQTAVVELQGLASRTEQAFRSNETQAFLILSERWRDLAGMVTAMVGQRSGEEAKVVTDLEEARRLGREAKKAMYEQGKALGETAGEFVAAMTLARDALPQLAEELLATMEPHDER